MVKDVVIRAEALGKKYLIDHATELRGHVTFRDTLIRGACDLWRKTADMAQGRAIVAGDTIEEFWALKNASFEVQRGEVLGIIGRNGAGKSTLLKILSRITEPSHGRITINGRVASLLEVGTGFHPELTGRENVYLNGAILGMTRAEIHHKFDQIVAFAEVEKFLDTPVKRYSSGMYVRLAFAVAAHLEPDILVVDEVLSVGDAEFQKKCLGKIDEVSRGEGRSVLFVSHNLGAVAELADRAILLTAGCIAFDGAVSEAVSAYLSADIDKGIYISPHVDSNEAPYIFRAEALTSSSSSIHNADEPFGIKVWIRHLQPLSRGCLGIQIINQYHVSVMALYAYPPDCVFGNTPGETIIEFFVPKLRLNVGHFRMRIWLTGPPGGQIYEVLDDVCGFEVIRYDRATNFWQPDACVYREDFSWNITKLSLDGTIENDLEGKIFIDTE